MVRQSDVGVLQQVTEVTSGAVDSSSLYNNISKVAFSVAEEGIKMKSAEVIANTQGQLRQLRNEVFTNNAQDPAKAAQLYKAARNQLIENSVQQVSPVVQRRIRADFQGLTQRDDVGVDEWAIKQNTTNIVTGLRNIVNQSVAGAYEEGKMYASEDGVASFALTNLMEAESLVYNSSKSVQGDESAQELTSAFRGDYLKSFLSGVGETNPVKALEMLGMPEVSGSLDLKDREKLKKAFEGRAINISQINAEKEIIGFVKQNAMAISGQAMPLMELEDLIQRQGLSDLARSAFLRANGYSAEKPEPLSKVDRLRGRDSLTIEMAKFLANKDRTLEDFRTAQVRVAEALASGVITSAEAKKYNDEYITSFAKILEEEMGGYHSQIPKDADVANTSMIDEFYEQQVGYKKSSFLWFDTSSDAFKKFSDEDANILRSTVKVRLYEPYLKALEEQARARNTTVGGLARLPEQDRLEVQNSAFRYAKTEYLRGMGVAPVEGVDIDTQIDVATTRIYNTQIRKDIDRRIDAPVPLKEETRAIFGKFGIGQ